MSYEKFKDIRRFNTWDIGSGFTEQKQNIWTLSMPVCAEVNQSMQKIAKTIKISGEQNQEIGPSRSSRDWKDTKLAIIKSYVDYVSRHYGEPIVVFVGYGQSSTKDMMHRRQSNKANRPMMRPQQFALCIL